MASGIRRFQNRLNCNWNDWICLFMQFRLLTSRWCVADWAKSRIETITSRSSVCRMWAYWGFASSKSISSTRSSYLPARTWRRSRTGSGTDSQLGNECPLGDRRWYAKSLSWGMTVVAVHSKDLIECSTSGSTYSHCDSSSHLDATVSAMCFQMMPLYRSHTVYFLVGCSAHSNT